MTERSTASTRIGDIRFYIVSVESARNREEIEDMSTKLEETLGNFETSLFELVGDEFAPKQENGSPERKRLLGLIGESYKLKDQARADIKALFKELSNSCISPRGDTKAQYIDADELDRKIDNL